MADPVPDPSRFLDGPIRLFSSSQVSDPDTGQLHPDPQPWKQVQKTLIAHMQNANRNQFECSQAEIFMENFFEQITKFEQRLF